MTNSIAEKIVKTSADVVTETGHVSKPPSLWPTAAMLTSGHPGVDQGISGTGDEERQ